MRLLQHGDNGELNLTEDFAGDDVIPPYAILSHTWGADTDEVTFEDLVNGTGKDKPGYKKIQFCREQARQDDLQYFWIDTCCINKDNRAELSLAINSMFRWYHKASRCYVYLSDVSKKRARDSEDTWELDFRKSRWFTRGWTLQELLAPTSVEFFSQERRRLGDKSSLRQQIHEITNISHSALQGDRLSQFSVEERLRWIEHRETKLEEDKVYSLLGIFDVYILPAYGEGTASARQKCIQDLRLTDPRDDKKRIEDTKGGLLDDAYCWILENPDFQQWRDDQKSCLLWINGEPGKGKTMLLCGLINELNKSINKTALLSFFFCQATDLRIKNAIAVLRGLVYLLADQQPSLISHIQKKYNYGGRTVFEDANAWVAMSEIFTNILQDPSLNSTYLIIDALDECIAADLPKLLDFIVQKSSISPRVKWIVSSRNWSDIKKRLERSEQKVGLCLELNAESVSVAVSIYIRQKVHQLAQEKEYDDKTRNAVLDHLSLNAESTFLWVALVYENLQRVKPWNVLARLNEFPPGLDPLYRRMMEQINYSDDAALCKQILASIAIVYRPVTLKELASFIDMPGNISYNLKWLPEIISLCGSFLTVREGTIYFVHQSAKEYLLTSALNKIFPSGVGDVHYLIFSRSLQAMSQTLHQDIYKLRLPGISANLVETPDPDPLVSLRYPCVYWANHLQEAYKTSVLCQSDLMDDGAIYQFLQNYFLYWLEALSLIRDISMGVLAIYSLERVVLINTKAEKSPKLHLFVHDIKRFTLYNRSVIEQAPLQLYLSALIFAPKKSIVRQYFQGHIPTWIQRKSETQDNWRATLQTLEGHSREVASVAFSLDGNIVASGSYDNTVRLWDASTGAALQTLEGHSNWVMSVAYSPDGNIVASGSYDNTVRLWNADTGMTLQTLEGHSRGVMSVAFSPGGNIVASGSYDNTVRLWSADTGMTLQTLEGHSRGVTSVAFSPDGNIVASGSYDRTVRLWDADTGMTLQTLEGHSHGVTSVAFSPDGNIVASGSYDNTVRLWDAGTSTALQMLEGHSREVTSVAFSPDGNIVASGSYDNTVQLWDASTGAALQTLEGHSDWVTSVAFSLDGNIVASGSYDNTVRLWDAGTSTALQTLEDHSHRTLEGHSRDVTSVAFSLDGNIVASGSYDRTVRLWDASTGAALQTLEGHSNWVMSVAYSPDGNIVASGSYNNTVRLWDAGTGTALQTLKGHSDWVMSVAFSLDGKYLKTNMGVLQIDSSKVVWLPPDYRATCIAVWDRIITLGHSSVISSMIEAINSMINGNLFLATVVSSKRNASR
ncbi:hypothetical protein BGZ60DRAFT_468818 [Tricladium varicosporioides]|nr:hypothetical protein BGZ60DRAFT_468818 [Hymenoscyphus varicosporioides]